SRTDQKYAAHTFVLTSTCAATAGQRDPLPSNKSAHAAPITEAKNTADQPDARWNKPKISELSGRAIHFPRSFRRPVKTTPRKSASSAHGTKRTVTSSMPAIAAGG